MSQKIQIVNYIFLFLSGMALLFCSACKQEHEEILLKKGFTAMEKRLKPDIIKINKTIEGLLGLNIKNTLGTVNGKGEFCLLELKDNNEIDLSVLVPGFPPYMSDKYYSNNEHNMIWMTGGRGFYALDIETKQTRHLVVSYDGDDGILNTFLADPENKIFYYRCTIQSESNQLLYIV